MPNILITGAASAIAQATARIWAKEGAAFFLTDQSAERLQAVEQDLTVRGATRVVTSVADLVHYDRHPELWEQATKALGHIDVLLIAHGTLPQQTEGEQNWLAAQCEININFMSAASLITLAANYFATRRQGTIAVISSVAGERGRQSNYIYGTAKGALTLFTQGVRNRLADSGVHVLTIKPGFVDTPMTAAFKKGILWAQPTTIGQGIVRAIRQHRDVVYLPWWWRYVMLGIKAIPERFFKRLKL